MEIKDENEFSADMLALLDMTFQVDAAREAVAETKKEMKTKYGIEVKIINAIITILKNKDLEEKDTTWESIKKLVKTCQDNE